LFCEKRYEKLKIRVVSYLIYSEEAQGSESFRLKLDDINDKEDIAPLLNVNRGIATF
jgi:hypothetical protein